MSFILDAIAKSEQERQQQQMPDARSLAFPAVAPERSRNNRAPYMLAGLLLGCAILFAIWMQAPRSLAPFAEPGGPTMPAPEAAGQPPAPAGTGDAPPAAPAESPAPKSAAPMLAESADGESAVRAPSSPAGETLEAPAAEAAVDPPAASSLRESEPAPAATAAQNPGAAGDSRQAGLETAYDAPAPDPPPPEVETPRRKVSRLSDLPADVRRVLPSVVFTGHLYSKNPRASYVFVDGGRQVVAGQQITDDLLLDEITPTGVVVEFQGYLIEVGVLQNWSLK